MEISGKFMDRRVRTSRSRSLSDYVAPHTSFSFRHQPHSPIIASTMSFCEFVYEAGHSARINLAPGPILQAIAASLLAAGHYHRLRLADPAADSDVHARPVLLVPGWRRSLMPARIAPTQLETHPPTIR